MKNSRRYLLLALYLAVLVFLGIWFAPIIRTGLLTPAATTIWLVLRVFVLSIDQKYYWAAAIILGAFLALRRLIRELDSREIYEQVPVANAALQKADIWRGDIQFGAGETANRSAVRRELTRMLVSMHMSKQQGNTYADTLDALKQRQIPLPEGIYVFLFPDQPDDSQDSRIKKAFQSVRQAPRKWMRKWTGRTAAEYYRGIDEILAYMENLLEMHHDDGHSEPSEH